MTKIKQTFSIEKSSFRDPSGFVFYHNQQIYRQVNKPYKPHFDTFINSKLYRHLSNLNLIVSHQKSNQPSPQKSTCYQVIKPQLTPFISYPWEWSFSQLKDAALLTLKIFKIALDHNMILKDASAFNVQFINSKPIFIDTLSFEIYQPNQPWIAYRQFCQHFLAPLALMARVHPNLLQLFQTSLDGIPLHIASNTLPKTTFLNPSLLIHIHLHSLSQQKLSLKSISLPNKYSKQSLYALIISLQSATNQLHLKQQRSLWSHYYQHNNYTSKATSHKQKIVKQLAKKINPKTTWDLGANTGRYSRLIASKNNKVIAFDNDPLATELNYQKLKKSPQNILPLNLDLTNPTPNLGFANQERYSLTARGPADLTLALALVHHLHIANNIPLAHISNYFSQITKHLLIEYIPKSDSQVKKLLQHRPDIFYNYTQSLFETSFKKNFKLIQKTQINQTDRFIYHFVTKNSS